MYAIYKINLLTLLSSQYSVIVSFEAYRVVAYLTIGSQPTFDRVNPKLSE